MRTPRTSTSRPTVRLPRAAQPPHPHARLPGPGDRATTEVLDLVLDYVADMERLERSEVWG